MRYTLWRSKLFICARGVSTPPLSVWSLPTTPCGIVITPNCRREAFHINVSCSPPFLSALLFVSTPTTHLCLLSCLVWDPRLGLVVMLITCLLCFAGAHHPSKRLSLRFISHRASPPVIRFGWGRRWILLAPYVGSSLWLFWDQPLTCLIDLSVMGRGSMCWEDDYAASRPASVLTWHSDFYCVMRRLCVHTGGRVCVCV